MTDASLKWTTVTVTQQNGNPIEVFSSFPLCAETFDRDILLTYTEGSSSDSAEEAPVNPTTMKYIVYEAFELKCKGNAEVVPNAALGQALRLRWFESYGPKIMLAYNEMADGPCKLKVFDPATREWSPDSIADAPFDSLPSMIRVGENLFCCYTYKFHPYFIRYNISDRDFEHRVHIPGRTRKSIADVCMHAFDENTVALATRRSVSDAERYDIEMAVWDLAGRLIVPFGSAIGQSNLPMTIVGLDRDHVLLLWTRAFDRDAQCKSMVVRYDRTGHTLIQSTPVDVAPMTTAPQAAKVGGKIYVFGYDKYSRKATCSVTPLPSL